MASFTDLFCGAHQIVLKQADNIVCDELGLQLQLIDVGHAFAWQSRLGRDVVPDGHKTRLEWNSKSYHCSSKNSTVYADASVDQFSLAFVIIEVLLGRDHIICLNMRRRKKVFWCF
jgi:hypothetical protein